MLDMKCPTTTPSHRRPRATKLRQPAVALAEVVDDAPTRCDHRRERGVERTRADRVDVAGPSRAG